MFKRISQFELSTRVIWQYNSSILACGPAGPVTNSYIIKYTDGADTQYEAFSFSIMKWRLYIDLCVWYKSAVLTLQGFATGFRCIEWSWVLFYCYRLWIWIAMNEWDLNMYFPLTTIINKRRKTRLSVLISKSKMLSCKFCFTSCLSRSPENTTK